MVVRLKMGRYADLSQTNFGTAEDVLDRAWEYRRARLSKRVERAEAVSGATLSAGDWARLFEALDRAQAAIFDRASNRGGELPVPSMKAAGRGGVADLSATQYFRVGADDESAMTQRALQSRLGSLYTDLARMQAQLKKTPEGPEREALQKKINDHSVRVREISKMLSRERLKPQRVEP